MDEDRLIDWSIVLAICIVIILKATNVITISWTILCLPLVIVGGIGCLMICIMIFLLTIRGIKDMIKESKK